MKHSMKQPVKNLFRQSNAFKVAMIDPSLYLTFEAFEDFRKTFTTRTLGRKFFLRHHPNYNCVLKQR